MQRLQEPSLRAGSGSHRTLSCRQASQARGRLKSERASLDAKSVLVALKGTGPSFGRDPSGGVGFDWWCEGAGEKRPWEVGAGGSTEAEGSERWPVSIYAKIGGQRIELYPRLVVARGERSRRQSSGRLVEDAEIR